MGGIIIFLGDLGPVPDPDATTTGARSACSARRSRARCSASPTTTRRSSSAARSACAARTKLGVTIAISLGLWWIAHAEGAACRRRCGCASSTRTIDLGVFYPRAHLPRRRRHDERGQPHRRARRPRRRLRGDRAARLHRHHVHHHRPARPRAARRLPRRRVRRLPVVQRVPGDDLHGRHRLARARRRDRRAGGDDARPRSC